MNQSEQLEKLKKEIELNEASLLKLDRKMHVEETMEADSYKRLKKQILEAMENAQRELQELKTMDTSFEKYCRFGMNILTDLDYYFEEASLEIKRKLLGSIFPGKLTFEDGKYRTDGLNPALAPILQKNKGVEKEKTGNIVISENVSGELPMTGQLSNHFIEGMRKIYELEPFINMESSLADGTNKVSKNCKKAV